MQAIISQLKNIGIAYNAPELETLSQSAVVADLLTLCRALANDTDRLAWMALLRAPWCGLQLSDLLSISNYGGVPGNSPIWLTLQSEHLQQQLSEDGRHRLLRILPALSRARAKRDRLSLRVWIEQTWVGLGGPCCAAHTDHLLDAETFLQLLEVAETEGVGLDLDWLMTRLPKYYLAAGDPGSKVQLLTLHKAKGLEFDRVILPQLDRLPARDAREILEWDEHSNSSGDRSFLLAADDHSPHNMPTLYNYLRTNRQQKAILESTRLLYVGTTRAIHNLLLTACIALDENTGKVREPSSQSLLRRIWPTFSAQMRMHTSAALQQSRHDSHSVSFPPLLRLELRESAARKPNTQNPTASTAVPAIQPQHRTERCIGSVVHQALEELSQRPSLPTEISTQDKNRWRRALQRLGIWGRELDSALQEVMRSVSCCLQPNSTGRWVLCADHYDAHSEWALTTVDSRGHIQDIVIDRCFTDTNTGVTWIIDYKNGQPAGDEHLDDFTRRQGALYLDQLRCYRDAIRELNIAPLRCGLFFSSLGYLHLLPELDLPAKVRPDP
ncbi:MAG: 3'-5' exonuclease [Halioglobus sp.]